MSRERTKKTIVSSYEVNGNNNLSHIVRFLCCKHKKQTLPAHDFCCRYLTNYTFIKCVSISFSQIITLLLVALGSFTSCVNSDLMDCSLAYIIIEPTDHEYELPGLHYHFYRKDGLIKHTVLPCDGKGNFSGRLMTGDYWVVATNTTAENALFLDMENHDSATVHVRKINMMDASGNTKINSPNCYLTYPGDIYTISLEHLSVGGRDTIRLSPKPILLTKNILLKFTIGENLEYQVIGLTGELQGIYPHVSLYSYQPTEYSINPSLAMSTRFTATGEGDQWQTRISLLGICDPEYGAKYRNILSLILSANEKEAEVNVELTDILSDIIRKNGGTIPVEVPIEIKIQREGILLVAEVKPWENSGSGGAVIN